MVRKNLSYFKYCIAFIMVFPIFVHYFYKERLEDLCTNTKILSRAYILPSSASNRPKVVYEDAGDLFGGVAKNEIVALQEIRNDTWLAYVPESNKTVSKDLNSLTVLPNTVTADYYSHVLDYHLWLGRLVPQTLWESYRDAVVYAEKEAPASCEAVTGVEVARLVNLFSASTGDLFSIAAKSTGYYIDDKGKNIILLHEHSYMDKAGKVRKYYQGHLKAQRGKELIALFVQDTDIRKVFASLAKSSTSL